ncbi:MAG: PEP-CTERM sorting domain-containing protein, partial [Sphingomonadales bacterium]
TGQFGTVQGDDATFQLSQAVNYFGLWGSALDGNNSVALYNNGALLGSFALQSVLQSSSGFNSGYYGNPFGGGNSGEMYAFFNFASDSAFNEVRLIQNGGGGFEFDNLTVGTKVVSAAPEPGTWAMLLFGFGMIGMALRGSRRTRPIAQRAAA